MDRRRKFESRVVTVTDLRSTSQTSTYMTESALSSHLHGRVDAAVSTYENVDKYRCSELSGPGLIPRGSYLKYVSTSDTGNISTTEKLNMRVNVTNSPHKLTSRYDNMYSTES